MENNKPVPDASKVLRMAIPSAWEQVDAWLKEKHGWSLAGWLEGYIEATLDLDNRAEQMIADDLEARFKLPKSEFSLNVNEMLSRLGRPIYQFDKNNRIVSLRMSGDCPRCGCAKNNMLGELVVRGKALFIGCNVCLLRDGYLPRYPIT